MARKTDREKALLLRKQGLSYSQIKDTLNINKSTLSYWLRNYPLSKNQIDTLRGKNPKRIEKFRETMRLKRETRLKKIYDERKMSLLPLTNKELLIAGLFLYWGEGSKTTDKVSINNTDPEVLKFTLFWFINILKVPKEKIRVELHLYKDSSVDYELNFWSKELSIQRSQFSKPYIKASSRENLTRKGFGHGTCGLAIYKIDLKEQIMMSIKAISDNYSTKI